MAPVRPRLDYSFVVKCLAPIFGYLYLTASSISRGSSSHSARSRPLSFSPFPTPPWFPPLSTISVIARLDSSQPENPRAFVHGVHRQRRLLCACVPAPDYAVQPLKFGDICFSSVRESTQGSHETVLLAKTSMVALAGKQHLVRGQRTTAVSFNLCVHCTQAQNAAQSIYILRCPQNIHNQQPAASQYSLRLCLVWISGHTSQQPLPCFLVEGVWTTLCIFAINIDDCQTAKMSRNSRRQGVSGCSRLPLPAVYARTSSTMTCIQC